MLWIGARITFVDCWMYVSLMVLGRGFWSFGMLHCVVGLTDPDISRNVTLYSFAS
jgi:hypothetical protein